MSLANQRPHASLSLGAACASNLRSARTLAFRQPAEGAELLDPGQEPTLAVTFDGLSTVSGRSRNADVADLIRSIYAVLELYGIDDDLCEGIIHAMISGERDGPAEEAPSAEEAAILAEVGHILLPIIDAGVDRRIAARVTEDILDMPIAAQLSDLKLLREQTAARNLITLAA